jgi:hypothetical protein
MKVNREHGGVPPYVIKTLEPYTVLECLYSQTKYTPTPTEQHTFYTNAHFHPQHIRKFTETHLQLTLDLGLVN